MKVNKRMASQPRGVYVITTITEKEYREKARLHDEKAISEQFRIEVKQHNLDNCGRTFKIQRKKFRDNADILVNFVIGDSQKALIPNIIIDEIYSEKESKEKYPEYWL